MNTVKHNLREYNIRPNRRLGQNFLVDKYLQGKMIDALGLSKEDIVLEIGPGMGVLTKELCRCAGKVIAIEKDRRLHEYLLKNCICNNLELIQGDILRYDFKDKGIRHLKVVGNLPYYISSPIIVHLLDNRDVIDTIFITVQKEFAERLTAREGGKDYGSISCFVQFYTEPVKLFSVKKSAFFPSPKVDSCFLRIDVRKKELYLTDEEKLFKIIRACFEKRRKMIFNSLYAKGFFSSKEDLLYKLEIAGISPQQRPETISLEKFVKLANVL